MIQRQTLRRTLTAPLQTMMTWSWRRALVWGVFWGAVLAWGGELGRMVFFRNVHCVLDGQVYRTSQMPPKELERFVKKRRIRTVINLRGHPPADWYPFEAQTTQDLGISQEDIALSANRLPAPSELRRLIEVLDRSEYPLLIHCKQGADRTGLVSAIVLLLHSDADYATARRQCSPRFGHVGMMNTTRAMDQFFVLYEEWLTQQRQTHTPVLFRQWATMVYAPGQYVAKLQLVAPLGTLPLGTPTTVRVRATNTSRKPWRFRAGTAVGVHLRYIFNDAHGNTYEGRVGFRELVVPPSESVTLTIPLPSLTKPGQCSLYADLSDGLSDFVQYGSEPLECGIDCVPMTARTSAP